ncbi:SAM-dependent methyltransferase [Actinomadura decatromicini]|uniref:SAM-dependent methyltransferase n=1 Tax=Actinomadura decatromicini TaxID=2604572 RepID=A0A5D3FCB0_9ACTN|nr:SAM-dependent methyltransferase [Actinomadura decatromicini]TYK45951.1 SAM-dependent methyltransferase [Actinomadura decatromicini]
MAAAEPAAVQPEIPHAARIWNYWMGGKDNYESDRAAGDAVAAVYPEIVAMARESRRFLIRAVTFLAQDRGVRQFVDVGTGLPTMENTHEVAQHVAPESRIVYVDNDPTVLVHARALLGNTTAEGVTTYVHADYHDPDLILAEAREVLDLDEPVAVMFMGVLGYEPDLAVARAIVGRLMDAVPSGSHLVLWDGTDTGSEVVDGAEKLVESGGVPYVLRAPAQLARFFEGLEVVEPGLVPITHWRPDDAAELIDAYGAVGRKG